MPATLDVDPERRFVRIAFRGDITPDDVLSLQREARTLAEFGAGWRALVDLSDMNDLLGTTTELQNISMNPAAKRLERIAIVASRDSVFGIARMYQQRGGADNMQVFRGLDDALAWLDGRGSDV